MQHVMPFCSTPWTSSWAAGWARRFWVKTSFCVLAMDGSRALGSTWTPSWFWPSTEDKVLGGSSGAISGIVCEW